MNHSGDAAEQIVRLSLEGVEVAARITGTAAKEIATFIVAALKSNDKKLKLKGKARMASMLKSGKALEIFSVKDRDLQKFMQGAKQYGIVYCVLRNRNNTPDGLCDIMVKADDAPKISRLVERFKFATVDKAKIESEIMRAKVIDNAELRMDNEKSDHSQLSTVNYQLDRGDTKKLVDDLMGVEEGKAKVIDNAELRMDNEKPDHSQFSTVNSQSKRSPAVAKTEKQPDAPDVAKTTTAKDAPANPTRAKTEKSLPSEPISGGRSNSAKGTLSEKPSVRGELREIKAGRQAKKEAEAPARGERQPDKPRGSTSTTHTQPPRSGKPKKSKVR
jgi:hypothetical protein